MPNKSKSGQSGAANNSTKLQRELVSATNALKAATSHVVSNKPRNRRRKAAKSRQTVSAPPTLEQVQRGMRQMTVSKPSKGNPYLMCRMNALGTESSGGAFRGIPDGGNSNYIIVELRQYDVISFDGGVDTVIMQTVPFLPMSLAFTSLGNHTYINGNRIGPADDLGGQEYGWYPAGIANSLKSVFTDFDDTPNYEDPWSSTSARLVSAQHKVTYTGPATTCAGTYMVTPNSLTLSEPVTCSTAADIELAGNVYAYRTWFKSDATTNGAKIGPVTQMYTIDGENAVAPYNSRSTLQRQDRSIVLTPRHKTADFKIIPTSQRPYGITKMTMKDATAPNHATNWFTSTQVGNSATSVNDALFWHDNDWEGYQLTISGQDTGASYVVETALCFEMSVEAQSAFMQFAHKASPLIPGETARVNTLINSLPIST